MQTTTIWTFLNSEDANKEFLKAEAYIFKRVFMNSPQKCGMRSQKRELQCDNPE